MGQHSSWVRGLWTFKAVRMTLYNSVMVVYNIITMMQRLATTVHVMMGTGFDLLRATQSNELAWATVEVSVIRHRNRLCSRRVVKAPNRIDNPRANRLVVETNVHQPIENHVSSLQGCAQFRTCRYTLDALNFLSNRHDVNAFGVYRQDLQ